MKKIRIGIVGVGNCASSLVQGLQFYKNKKSFAGLMHPVIGGYDISHIEPVLGFDVDERKVGQDISKAIFAKPNVATKFSRVPRLNAPVYVGPVLDGVSAHMREYPSSITFKPTNQEPVDVAEKLRKHKVDILINYLPVGSQKATEFYADAALKAGCGFVNCVPVFIASDKNWVSKFKRAKLPCLGDDIKSQLGATWAHRAAVQSYLNKGIKILFTSQENYGGNTDFLNMTDSNRIKGKLKSKESSIKHLIEDHPKGGYKVPPIYAGPGTADNNHGYIKKQGDNKTAIIKVEGLGFGNLPVTMECHLSVEDSPNSAGIVVDAIRCCKVALDKGMSGTLDPSSFFFKHPLRKVNDDESVRIMEDFVKKK
jgi:myo-inositol-1-phosphate synthase